jgi:hypothetical protein
MADEGRSVMQAGRRLFIGLTLSLCYAVFTCFVSNNLQPRFQNRHDSIQKEFSLLEGKPFLLGGWPIYLPEFQNRVLFAAALKALNALGVASVEQCYLFLRLCTAVLAFFMLWQLLTRTIGADDRTAAVGLGALAYTLVFEFNHGWEHPTDFQDVIFTLGFLWASLHRRWVSLILITFVACFSRESAVFAGLIWFSLYGFTQSWKLRVLDAGYALILCTGSYATVLGIRYLLGGGQALTRLQTFNLQNIWPQFVKPVLLDPTLSSWPILLLAMLAPVLLWLFANKQVMCAWHSRLLGAALAIGMISITLASIDELRILIPSTTILVFVTAAMETQRQILIPPPKSNALVLRNP